MTESSRTFTLPDDISRALALGEIKRGDKTESQIRKRLTGIRIFADRGFVPDMFGRKKATGEDEVYERQDGTKLGRDEIPFYYENITAPPELSGHMEDLITAVDRALDLIDVGPLQEARERLECIEMLVRDMRLIASYETRLRNAGKKGGKAKGVSEAQKKSQKAGQVKSDIDDILDRNPNMSRTAARAP